MRKGENEVANLKNVDLAAGFTLKTREKGTIRGFGIQILDCQIKVSQFRKNNNYISFKNSRCHIS